MTRKNQNLRAWIERESPAHCYLSKVSHKGKVHTIRTTTCLRKAALEFNTLHILRVINQPTPTHFPTLEEPELISL